MGPSPIGGTINFLKGRVNQNGNDTRKTDHVHFALCAADLTAAVGVRGSGGRVQRATLRGQDWKAWVQLEKAGLSLTGVEQMVRDLRDAVRRYQDEVADAAIAARSVRDAEEWGQHG